MTIYFQSHEIVIRRLRPYGADIQNYSATFTSYLADIQPMNETRTNLAGGRIGQMFDCFIDSSVMVKEGDQIDSGGKRYSIKNVIEFYGAGLLDHKQLILTSVDGDEY